MNKKTLGLILVISGGLAWPVGLWLKLKPFPYIIVPHILLIVPGVILRGSHIIEIIKKKRGK